MRLVIEKKVLKKIQGFPEKLRNFFAEFYKWNSDWLKAMVIKAFPQQESQNKLFFSIYIKSVYYCKQQFSTLNHTIPYPEKNKFK